MIKTTIVIPNYNGIKYLKNCIEKLLVAKECGDFEILLVDNGSTDGSERLCREYAAQGIAKVIAFIATIIVLYFAIKQLPNYMAFAVR